MRADKATRPLDHTRRPLKDQGDPPDTAADLKVEAAEGFSIFKGYRHGLQYRIETRPGQSHGGVLPNTSAAMIDFQCRTCAVPAGIAEGTGPRLCRGR